MLFVKICLGLLMIIVIIAIYNKDIAILILGIPLAPIPLLVGVCISS